MPQITSRHRRGSAVHEASGRNLRSDMEDQGGQEWVGTPAAAAYLGIRLRTLYRLINDGRLPAYRPARVFRVRKVDLDEFLDACRVRRGELDHLCGPDVGLAHEPQDDDD